MIFQYSVLKQVVSKSEIDGLFRVRGVKDTWENKKIYAYTDCMNNSCKFL